MENSVSVNENDLGFECFSNFTSSEVFVQGCAGFTNQHDIEQMIRAQKQMLQRFEKSNEMLVNCNALSQVHLQKANQDFKKHVQLLNDMRKDLENIFKRIKILKSKAENQYPLEFKEAVKQLQSASGEEDQNDLC
nr:EOG090X0CBU [Macrothrix elegans]